MMTLEITVYKDTGKFYTSALVTGDDIPMYAPGFKAYIRQNLPAVVKDSFVVVRDDDKNATFHNCLFRIDELLEEEGEAS